MPSTTRGYPYPALSDAPNGPSQMQALATAINVDVAALDASGPGVRLAAAASTGSDDNNLGTLSTQRLLPACKITITLSAQRRIRAECRGRMWNNATTGNPFHCSAHFGYYSGNTAPTDGTGGGAISPAITELTAPAAPTFRNLNGSTDDPSNFTLFATVLLAAGTYTFLAYGVRDAGGVTSGAVGGQDQIGRGYLALYDAGPT